MPKPEPDFTEAEAIAHIAEHERKHGREMHAPPGHDKPNDVPTRAELDAVTPFVEPPDLGEVDTEGDDT